MNQFLDDVLKGLRSEDKYLESKYFYDAKGDALFQQIMHCEDYYPTRCELDIFTNQSNCLVKTFKERSDTFDVLELGAGDGLKSGKLLQELIQQDVDFTYYPIDISANVIAMLNRDLPKKIKGLKMQGLNGEYLLMLEKAQKLSAHVKLVLFMGGNIGNIPLDNAASFCSSLRKHLLPGDLLLIGFDLKKDPRVILNAYNDRQGLTKQFNLNLLQRINDELGGDFKLSRFEHYPNYDPQTGACKSFLVSTEEQVVHLADESFHFKKGETIFMEISQKYTTEQTDQLATASGFEPVAHFYDNGRWFLDALWKCI